MEGEPPAQAPALEDPVGFEALGDDLVRTAFLRAPFMTHGTLHVVCRRLKALLRSPEFLQQRVRIPVLWYTLSIDHHGSKVTFARLVRTQQYTLHIGMSQPVTHVIDSDVMS